MPGANPGIALQRGRPPACESKLRLAAKREPNAGVPWGFCATLEGGFSGTD